MEQLRTINPETLLPDRIPHPNLQAHFAIWTRCPGHHGIYVCHTPMRPGAQEDVMRKFQEVWNGGDNGFLECWIDHRLPTYFPKMKMDGCESVIAHGFYRARRNAPWKSWR